MALRADEEISNSPLPGVTYFWQEADKSPSNDWEQWMQLFEVAVLARHSISITKLLRNADQQNPRQATLMGNMEETHAKRKVISLLYIAIGKTGRKMLMDKFPQINICLIELQDIIQHFFRMFSNSTK